MDFTSPGSLRSYRRDRPPLLTRRCFPSSGGGVEKGFGAAGPEYRSPAGKRVLGMGPARGWESGEAGSRSATSRPSQARSSAEPVGHYVFNVPGARRGRHGAPPPPRLRRAEGALAAAAGRAARSGAASRMTEPEFPARTPSWLGTTAERDGDSYVIDGHKWFTTAADGAAFAIVMAVTNPERPKPHARASQILGADDTPGFELVQNICDGPRGRGLDEPRRGAFDGAACRSRTASATRAPGFALAQERLGRGGSTTACAGSASASGRSTSCASGPRRASVARRAARRRQIVQEWIAESRAEIDAARLLVLRAAWDRSRGGRRRARRHLAHQVPRRRRAPARARPRDPDPRRARPHRRHAARVLVAPRARRPHLRRRRRGPQDGRGAADPRRGYGMKRAGRMIDSAIDSASASPPRRGDRRRRARGLAEGRLLGIEGPVTVEQFPGGHSNLTYLSAGTRELVLRRPPVRHQGKDGARHGPRVPHALARFTPSIRKAPRSPPPLRRRRCSARRSTSWSGCAA